MAECLRGLTRRCFNVGASRRGPAARRGSRIYTADVPARHAGTLLAATSAAVFLSPWPRDPYFVLPCPALAAPFQRSSGVTPASRDFVPPPPPPPLLPPGRRFYLLLYICISYSRLAARRALGALAPDREYFRAGIRWHTRHVLTSLLLAVMARFIPRIRTRSAAGSPQRSKHGGGFRPSPPDLVLPLCKF
jgi:hypothetical protein